MEDRPRHFVVGNSFRLEGDTIMVHTKNSDVIWEAPIEKLSNNERFINGLSQAEAYRFGYMLGHERMQNAHNEIMRSAGRGY